MGVEKIYEFSRKNIQTEVYYRSVTKNPIGLILR